MGRDYVRLAVTVVLSGIFVATVTKSVTKLLEAKVSIEADIANDRYMLFPSVTACAQMKSDFQDAETRKPNFTRDMGELKSLRQQLFLLEQVYVDENNQTKTFAFNASIPGSESVNGTSVVYSVASVSNVGHTVRNCVTYDPPAPSPTGIWGALTMRLNATDVKLWTLSLHTKGDFFPGFSRHFGSTVAIAAPPASGDKVGKYLFAIEKTVATYDQAEPEYYNDANLCLSDAIAKEMGCRLDPALPGELPLCSPHDDVYERFLNVTFGMTLLSEKYLSDETGCYGPCKRTEFEAKLYSNEHEMATNDTEGTIRVLIMYASSAYYVKSQYFAYDFVSLIGEVGGNLGLLLGWSLLTLYDKGRTVLDKRCKCEQ